MSQTQITKSFSIGNRSAIGTNVSFGPDIREGVVDWNGEGETVGGIVVMRDGMNALTVINGIKKKLVEINPALLAGVSS